MTLLIIAIPLMVVGFTIAIVPLVAVMRREHAMQDHRIWKREARHGQLPERWKHLANADGELFDAA
jgi:hypothetical protein